MPGQIVESMGRRGKYLLFCLTDKVLISHLRMEGKYFHYPDQVPERKSMPMFSSSLKTVARLFMRMYASLGLWNCLHQTFWKPTLFLKKLGPGTKRTKFDFAGLSSCPSQVQKPIKSHLLDQTLVAGLGNIYVDEVLWRAQVHPARPSHTLTTEEASAIHDQTISVLGQAVEKGGSTIRTYTNAFGEDGTMQDFHQVYDKAGQDVHAVGL